MNIRFYNAKILVPAENHKFQITEGELWVKGKEICYIGDGKTGVDAVCKNVEVLVWEREIDAKGNLLMPGFKDAHTHTAMTFLRSYADDLPLQDWLNKQVFPKEGQLTEDDVYWLNILGIMAYFTSGITSNFAMYFFPRPDKLYRGISCRIHDIKRTDGGRGKTGTEIKIPGMAAQFRNKTGSGRVQRALGYDTDTAYGCTWYVRVRRRRLPLCML